MASDYVRFAEQKLDIYSKSGDEYTVRCLFHQDSSPSMQFNVKSGLFLCWSCQAKGNIKTIMRHFGMTEINDIPDLDRLKERIAQLQQPKEEIQYMDEAILKRYQFPTKYWTTNRGFTPEVVRLFQLGYDPIENHGIIPVRALNGKLLSFVRRNLDPESKYDRYRNGKRFKKAHNLFGAWLVDKYQTNHVVVTEGPLDACSVWSAGIPAVAQFGSLMTPEHRDILHRIGIRKITLFYDNDNGGREATKTTLELLKGEFLVYKVDYRRSDGKDPGELSRKSIRNRIDKARWIA